jgi:hypothetical protein
MPCECMRQQCVWKSERARLTGHTGPTHRLDLGLGVKGDFVVVVNGRKLFLGDLDPGLGDEVDL